MSSRDDAYALAQAALCRIMRRSEKDSEERYHIAGALESLENAWDAGCEA